MGSRIILGPNESLVFRVPIRFFSNSLMNFELQCSVGSTVLKSSIVRCEPRRQKLTRCILTASEVRAEKSLPKA
jgi:hypothetical protein